jgi:replicative DNA helicase
LEEHNIIPHDIDAEQQILGAIILENRLIRSIDITRNDFYSIKHSEIFSHMLSLDADNTPIDAITLKSKGVEIAYTTQIAMNMITTANIKIHSEIVKELARKRALLRLCRETIEDIHTLTIDDLLSNMRNQTIELLRGRTNKIVSSGEIAKELLDFIERRKEHSGELSGIPSGFSELDSLTDGFQPGEITIIAGRPGAGKSAFAITCATNSKEPSGIISLEMGAHQIGIRQLSALSKIELWKLRKGLFSAEDMPDLTEGFKRMAELELYFSFTSHKTHSIEKCITQMIEAYGCKIIVIDYLQLTKGNESKKREHEVAEVSRTLKLCAMNHNIPIIVLSQLNRKVEERAQQKPILSDLRESGAIEQDADVVMFLWMPKPKEHPKLLELTIAKGRNCGLGNIYLEAEFDTMTFNQSMKPRDYE